VIGFIIIINIFSSRISVYDFIRTIDIMDSFDSNNSNGNDEPSVHPKFSIAPAGNASSASLNDWLDLNDIFYGK